jgi:hypothetical protein
VEIAVADVKETKAKPDEAEEKAPPTSGLFGFPGTTLFQPGQSGFKPEDGTLPYKPAKRD